MLSCRLRVLFYFSAFLWCIGYGRSDNSIWNLIVFTPVHFLQIDVFMRCSASDLTPVIEYPTVLLHHSCRT